MKIEKEEKITYKFILDKGELKVLKDICTTAGSQIGYHSSTGGCGLIPNKDSMVEMIKKIMGE